MYEDLTPEKIKSQMLDQIVNLDTREGSYTNNLISPAAYEIWKYYMALNTMIPVMFVDETSGIYIDRRCKDYDIYRKEGLPAKAKMTFAGKDGTVIPAGKIFLTEEGLEFFVTEEVVLSGGTGSVLVQSTGIGERYNIEAGEIVQQMQALSGLESFANEPAEGGTDEESDESLVSRLYEYLRNPSTSGNIYDYLNWATEVEGVGAAKVFPLWNGNGTVKVVIVDQNFHPAAKEIISACKEHIEKNRPIGADVTVVSAEEIPLEISAAVRLEQGTSAEVIRQQFEILLEEYLKGIGFKKTELIYNRVAFMLLDLEGVIDFTEMTINGKTENILVDEQKVLTVGTVVITNAD